MKKFTVPTLLTLLLAYPAYYVGRYFPWLPEQASAEAKPVDDLILLTFEILAVIFVLVMVFFLYSLWAFRRREGDTEDGTHIHGHTGLELAWILGPLVLVLVVWWHGVQVADGMGLLREMPEDADALKVNVTGQQWVWSFEYPEQEGIPASFVSDVLVMPLNRRVVFTITSPDVMHSFWIPEMRMKMDAIPGRANVMKLTPNKLGDYKVRCAELCGTDHAYMESPVRVTNDADFATFVIENDIASMTADQRGEKWYKAYGCAGCHSIDGKKITGPTWQDLHGSQIQLEGGETITADEDYLRTSILRPNEQIHGGFQPNIMPRNFEERFAADNADRPEIDELADIIEFIKSPKVDRTP